MQPVTAWPLMVEKWLQTIKVMPSAVH